MGRKAMEMKLFELQAKHPGSEVVWVYDCEIVKDGTPVDIVSVEFEEYWKEKNIVGEDEILESMLNDGFKLSSMSYFKELEYNCKCKIELMQDSGKITRPIVVKLGVL